MNFSFQITQHLREIYFGNNWTGTNYTEVLKDITWEEATKQISDYNTILKLVFHTYYFIKVVIPVLDGKELDAHDKFSFDHPIISSKTDWQQLLITIYADVALLASKIEKLSDEKLVTVFSDPKYGNYYRNLHGIIEHCHYHLGQIVIIKKLIRSSIFNNLNQGST